MSGTKITEDQAKRILDWLNRKWPGHKCDVCGENDWSLAEDLVTPLVISGKDIQAGGVSYPMAMVICSNCAQTKFFNAVRIGLGSPPAAERKGEKDG